MTPTPALAGIPPADLKGLYVFTFLPLRDATDARRARVVPAGLEHAGMAALSRAWRRTLVLGDADEFDGSDPAHRAALLPHDRLALLGWRLGLALAGDRLRRLIRRADLDALGDALSNADWRFLLGPHGRLPDSADDLLEAPPLPELAQACRELGWAVLDNAAAALPRDIGERLRLKLPPATSCALPPERCKAWVAAAYVAVASE